MAQKLVGHDVSVYSVQLGGFDGNPASGAVSSMIGRWESISITLTKEWSTVTSSDAAEPEKRKKLQTWKATCKTWIDTGGSQQVFAFLQSDLVVVVCKEINSGKTITLRGGIMKAGMDINADHGKDDLEIEDVGNGNFGGLQTFTYA